VAIAVNHVSCVGEGSWTLQCAQPKVLPLKSLLVPGANRQTLFGWEALPEKIAGFSFSGKNFVNGKCTVGWSQAVRRSLPDLPSLFDLFW